jgi:hypothetical protein
MLLIYKLAMDESWDTHDEQFVISKETVELHLDQCFSSLHLWYVQKLTTGWEYLLLKSETQTSY